MLPDERVPDETHEAVGQGLNGPAHLLKLLQAQELESLIMLPYETGCSAEVLPKLRQGPVMRLAAAHTWTPAAGQHCQTHGRIGLLADLVGRVSGASDGVVNVDCRGTQTWSSPTLKRLRLPSCAWAFSKVSDVRLAQAGLTRLRSMPGACIWPLC